MRLKSFIRGQFQQAVVQHTTSQSPDSMCWATEKRGRLAVGPSEVLGGFGEIMVVKALLRTSTASDGLHKAKIEFQAQFALMLMNRRSSACLRSLPRRREAQPDWIACAVAG
jgi:hypothetical protein